MYIEKMYSLCLK